MNCCCCWYCWCFVVVVVGGGGGGAAAATVVRRLGRMGSVVDEWNMSVENWWIDSDWGKPKNSEKPISVSSCPSRIPHWLVLALRGSEWSATNPGRFTPGRDPRWPNGVLPVLLLCSDSRLCEASFSPLVHSCGDSHFKMRCSFYVGRCRWSAIFGSTLIL